MGHHSVRARVLKSVLEQCCGFLCDLPSRSPPSGFCKALTLPNLRTAMAWGGTSPRATYPRILSAPADHRYSPTWGTDVRSSSLRAPPLLALRCVRSWRTSPRPIGMHGLGFDSTDLEEGLPEGVKRIPPTTENWLRKLYIYSLNNNTSTEDEHETNHINNKYKNMNTRKMHNL